MEPARTVKDFLFVLKQPALECHFTAGSIREAIGILESDEPAVEAFFALGAKLTNGGTAQPAEAATELTAQAGTATEATTGKPKRKRRTDAEIAADEARIAAATAPAPLAVPGAPAAVPPPPPLASAPPVVPAPAAPLAPPAPANFAPPPVVPNGALASAPTTFTAAPLPDLQVPDFLDRSKEQPATTATAPTPPVPPAPALPASIQPDAPKPLNVGKGAAEILAELRRRSAGNPAVEQQCADWVASFKTPDGTSNSIIAPGAKFDEIADALPFCRNDALAPLVEQLGLSVAG
jgi:hypothetical protein